MQSHCIIEQEVAFFALAIIPYGGDRVFIVKNYEENTDIAIIHESMEVTYEIAAYPSREYGTMTGMMKMLC